MMPERHNGVLQTKMDDQRDPKSHPPALVKMEGAAGQNFNRVWERLNYIMDNIEELQAYKARVEYHDKRMAEIEAWLKKRGALL